MTSPLVSQTATSAKASGGLGRGWLVGVAATLAVTAVAVTWALGSTSGATKAEASIAPIAAALPAPDPATLRLAGVVIAGQDASAMLSAQGGSVKIYRVGDVMDGGAVLQAIAFDHVIIARGGHTARINFPSTKPDLTAEAGRDAIARVAYAEAANQGDDGLAAVVYTIFNRLQDGRWGASIDDVVNAPHQFEPVMRAGGDWRNLPPVSEAKRARIDTIINLAMGGHLPDLTNGARYFQNPAIVAERARAGQVPGSLVHFGGKTPSAVIGAHTFYQE